VQTARIASGPPDALPLEIAADPATGASNPDAPSRGQEAGPSQYRARGFTSPR